MLPRRGGGDNDKHPSDPARTEKAVQEQVQEQEQTEAARDQKLPARNGDAGDAGGAGEV
jgi:hypothetical protein